MKWTPEQEALRERFVTALVEATFPLQQGPDREVCLELLILAAEQLREHLEKELAELRQEETD
jgi:hypothetical protein